MNQQNYTKQSDLINTLKTSRKNEYINLLRKIKYREYITKQDFILIEQFLENKSVPEKDQILIFIKQNLIILQ